MAMSGVSWPALSALVSPSHFLYTFSTSSARQQASDVFTAYTAQSEHPPKAPASCRVLGTWMGMFICVTCLHAPSSTDTFTAWNVGHGSISAQRASHLR
jgi:hypothetical protein